MVLQESFLGGLILGLGIENLSGIYLVSLGIG